MNNLKSIILGIFAFIVLFIVALYLCMSFYWIELKKNISLFEQTEIIFGLILFALNLSASAFALYLFISRDGMSLRIIYWFYSFVFLGIAPLVQGSFGIWRFYYDQSVLFGLSLVIIISHIFFTIGYIPSSYISTKKTKRYLIYASKQDVFRQNHFLDVKKIFIFSILSFIFSISLTGLYGFHFSSSIIRTMFGNTYSPTESMAEFFIRPFIFFSFSYLLYATVNGEKRNISRVSLFLLFSSVCLVIGPFSGARSIVFFLYFGLLIILMRHKMITYPRVFGSMLFVGILGSELQHILRSFLATGKSVNFSGINYFFQGHFDGFEMIAHTMMYVKYQGFEFGRQFLSAILFWIPRDLWLDKSVGSGDLIAYEHLAKMHKVDFVNLSMPFIGEAYLNFGILGVCFALLILGWFCGKEDGRFHTRRKFEANLVMKQRSEPVWMWRYGVLLGLSLFIYRGDLMSGLSFGAGLLLALICSWLMFHGQIRTKV